MKSKVREDQRAISGYRLGLAKHIPFWREPPEFASEPFLDAAVVQTRRAGGKDRIARREFEGEAASIEDTFRLQAEPGAPGEERDQLAERVTIQSGVPKQRERSGDLQ